MKQTINNLETEWVNTYPTIEQVTELWWREYHEHLKASGMVDIDPFTVKAIEAALRRTDDRRIIAEVFGVSIEIVDAVQSRRHVPPPTQSQLYDSFSGIIQKRHTQAKRNWNYECERAILTFYFGEIEPESQQYHYLSIAADQFRDSVKLHECGEKTYPKEFFLQTAAAYWHLYQTFKYFGHNLPERAWYL